MNKQLFDQAIGEPPPSTVDVDAVIARARRAAVVRRVASPWLAAAAGVVAVTVGITVVLVRGDSGSPVASGIVPTTAPTSSPAPVAPRLPCRDKPTMVIMTPGQRPPSQPTTEQALPEQAAGVARRLTEVLTAAARAQLPADATLQANPAAEYPKGVPHGPLDFYWTDPGPATDACPDGQRSLMARATVIQGKQQGNVMALVNHPVPDPARDTTCPPEGVAVDVDETCVRQIGPNGEIILVITMKLKGGGPTINRIEMTKPDGTDILLHAENVGRDAKYGGTPQSTAPPLTHQQLIAIALDPGMTAAAH